MTIGYLEITISSIDRRGILILGHLEIAMMSEYLGKIIQTFDQLENPLIMILEVWTVERETVYLMRTVLEIICPMTAGRHMPMATQCHILTPNSQTMLPIGMIMGLLIDPICTILCPERRIGQRTPTETIPGLKNRSIGKIIVIRKVKSRILLLLIGPQRRVKHL